MVDTHKFFPFRHVAQKRGVKRDCATLLMMHRCTICGQVKARETMHIQGSYTRKSGEKVYRYCCRTCKAERIMRYRNKV